MIENLPASQYQGRSWFLVGSAIALLMVSAASVYFEIQKQSVSRAVSQLEKQKKSFIAAEQMADENTIGTSPLLSFQQLRTSVANIRTKQFSWAKVIEKIENTIPKDKETQAALIQFRSYNAGADGEITVSALTRAGRPDPFGDISELISTFSNDPSFKKVFVPSITKSIVNSEGVSGAVVLSFSMTFQYSPQTGKTPSVSPKQEEAAAPAPVVPIPVKR